MNPQDSFVWSTFQPSSFWARRRAVVLEHTLPFQLDMLKTTGRYDAFDLKWHPIYDDEPEIWPVPKHLFWDSDVAKWVEGLCYFGDLEKGSDSTLDKAAHDLVQKIRKAQQPDGYLNIHFTVVDPKGRWTNLRDLHELYNLGHLVEGALAYQIRYKSNDLMDPIEKYVEYVHKTFGPGPDQKHGYPGHPEIELSLMRFYKRTGNKHALDLAKYFIEERGNPTGQDGKHYYDVEAEARGESKHVLPDFYPAVRSYWYNLAHKPLLEQDEIEGHAVRAMYLMTAMADYILSDPKGAAGQYLAPLKRLWDNMVNKKMYLTGGIGAISKWEGFGIDYFLPQSTDEGGCYAETCAAIGVMMVAERLLQIELDGRYADIMERSLYNAMLTGMSIDGKAFTYDNQMATCEENCSNKREEWFEVSCCPPNVSRVLGHMGGYLWTPHSTSAKAVTVNVHLYASATLEYTVPKSTRSVKLTQTTDYPWSGEVKFQHSSSEVETTVYLRIPHWAGDAWTLSPAPKSSTLKNGYLHLDAAYLHANPEFTLDLPLKPRLIRPHPYTNQRIAALARGPLVYCLEDVDNNWVTDHFRSLAFSPNVSGSTDLSGHCKEEWKTDMPLNEGYVGITIKDGGIVIPSDDLKPSLESRGIVESAKEKVDLQFVPYWMRANRGGKKIMRVGIKTVD